MPNSYIFQSRFNPTSLLSGVIVTGLGLFLLLLFWFHPDQKPVLPQYFLFVPAIWLVAAVMIFIAIKRYLPLKVDEQNIYVGNNTIPFNTINKLLLFGQMQDYSSSGETVIIKLKSGEDITLRIGYYTNGRTLRRIGERINQNIQNGIFTLQYDPAQPEANAEKIYPEDLRNEQFTKFFNNLFLLADFWSPGILLIAIIAAINWHSHKATMDITGLLIIFVMIQALIFLTMPNYFLVSQNYLVIKKRIPFWKPVIIPMKNIKRISTFSTSKGGSGIEILDSDYRHHVYRAGLIWSGDKLDEMIKMVSTYAGCEE